MNLIKIKDNSSRNSNEFSEIPNIISSVLDKSVSELEKTGIFVFPNNLKEQEGITEEQTILNKKWGKIIVLAILWASLATIKRI